jgi:CelD/BcsL family acetyltransferase involved in cellulose biosynthesis
MAKALQIEVSDAIDAAEWDASVMRLGGSIFHSSTWAAYVQAQQPNARPRFARFLSSDDALIGLCLMFAEASPRKMLAPLTGKLWTEAAPVVKNGSANAASALAEAIEGYARKQALATIVIGSFGGGAGTAAFANPGFQQTRFWEFVHDLSASEDVLWQRIGIKRHQKIRKAERMGVILEDCSHEEGIAELRRLQADSSERIVARGGKDITRKGKPNADPVRVLLENGLARIVCAKVDGQVVSAALFTLFDGLVYYTLSGHSEAALRSQAPTFLLWQMIKRYKAEGALRFNFGGCSAAATEEGHPEHGVFVYKQGFGGDQIECVTLSKVLLPIRHRAGVLLKRVVLGLARR